MFQPIIQEDFLDSYYFQYLDDWIHSFAVEWKFNRNVTGNHLEKLMSKKKMIYGKLVVQKVCMHQTKI